MVSEQLRPSSVLEAAFRWLAIGAAALLLAACVPVDAPSSPTSGGAAKFPPELIAMAFDAATAETLANQCPGGFQYDKRKERKMIDAYARTFTSMPAWAYSDPKTAVSRKEAEAWIYSYMDRRGVTINRPKTWCAAGAKEVAEKTRIGSLLIPR
jgi:hypothetical protein